MRHKANVPIIKRRYLKTYQGLWKSIMKSKEALPETSIINNINDSFFQEIPISQKYLTSNDSIIEKKIYFYRYNPLNPDEFDRSQIDDYFQGLLFYIFFLSNKKFNVEEVEFHFTGGKQIDQNSYLKGHVDILNIFDYMNVYSEITIKTVKYPFFGLTFKTVKVRPVSYSIRSGLNNNLTSHLVSFTFEAFDEQMEKWVVLDERVNVNNLIKTGGFEMFFVRSSEKFYSSFKIKQTDTGSNGRWGFSLCAFDIHGSVRQINDEKNELIYQCGNSELNIFDPCLDITELI